jgi:hypothetical protein
MAADGARTWILTCSPELYADRTPRRPGEPHTPDPSLRPNQAPEHWKLTLQAQLRIVSDADAGLPMDRIHAAAGVAA